MSAESPGKGQGASFTVALPAPAARRTLEVAHRTTTTPDGGRAAQALDGARILLVDDDLEFLEQGRVYEF